MLHLAPEWCLQKIRSIAGLDYLSANLSNPWAMAKIDLTNNELPDAAFDIICCTTCSNTFPKTEKPFANYTGCLKQALGC